MKEENFDPEDFKKQLRAIQERLAVIKDSISYRQEYGDAEFWQELTSNFKNDGDAEPAKEMEEVLQKVFKGNTLEFSHWLLKVIKEDSGNKDQSCNIH